MKTLEYYTKNGHEFTMFVRAANLAIFHGKRIGGKSDTWEVIYIQSHDGREIGGRYLPPAEFPPSNEQWGSKGWTYRDQRFAEWRFKVELEKNTCNPTPD
jgi:hypothetical protein